MDRDRDYPAPPRLIIGVQTRQAVLTIKSKGRNAMIETSATLKKETGTVSVMTMGMYLISVSDGIKDNGCIINSAVQITDDPVRIVFSLHKRSYTHKLLQKTGEFNLSVLDESASPELIYRFGYTNGREKSKFEDFDDCARSASGIYYLTRGACAMMSFETVALTDWDSHTLFTAKMKDFRQLSTLPPLSYSSYRKNAKEL